MVCPLQQTDLPRFSRDRDRPLVRRDLTASLVAGAKVAASREAAEPVVVSSADLPTHRRYPVIGASSLKVRGHPKRRRAGHLRTPRRPLGIWTVPANGFQYHDGNERA